MIKSFEGHEVSIRDVSLKVPELADEGIAGNVHRYYTPEGDGCGIYYFDFRPDLPDEATESEFLENYRQLIGDSGVELLELETVQQAGHAGLRQLVKVPQSAGAAFLASLTIPFKRFSFVVKLQCHERGMTGVREALLLDRMLGQGSARLDPSSGIVGDWSPYDTKYDAEFYDHPLSRARRWFPRIAAGMNVTLKLAGSSSFFRWASRSGRGD